jgi:hypothetical protein
VSAQLQKAANSQAEQKIAEQSAAIVQLKASHDQELRALEQIIETMRTEAVRNVAEIQSLGAHLAAEQHQRTSMTSQLAQMRASIEGDARILLIKRRNCFTPLKKWSPSSVLAISCNLPAMQ